MKKNSSRRVLGPAAAIALTLLAPASGIAQGSLPQHDSLGSLFTESEIGGLGCLGVSAVTGVALWRAMGGGEGVALAVNGIVSPARVLESAAAAAFVFSSTCYIGQALAPLTTTLVASLAEALFGPGNGSSAPARPRPGAASLPFPPL